MVGVGRRSGGGRQGDEAAVGGDPSGTRRPTGRDRRGAPRERRRAPHALRQVTVCLPRRPADPPRSLHPVDPRRRRQDRYALLERGRARSLPALVRQCSTSQGDRRQARDRVAPRSRDRAVHEDRQPDLSWRPDASRHPASLNPSGRIAALPAGTAQHPGRWKPTTETIDKELPGHGCPDRHSWSAAPIRYDGARDRPSG